jgi:hypothetical protein
MGVFNVGTVMPPKSDYIYKISVLGKQIRQRTGVS